MNKNKHVIWLVRHGESESNVDPTITKSIADHAVELTGRGQWQARMAGSFLNNRLPHSKVFVWSSPFMRAKQTSAAILHMIDEEDRTLIYRESPLLAEIDFGLANGLTAQESMEKYPENGERNKIRASGSPGGRFWAAHPGGESQAMVAFRVHSFFNDIFHTENETANREIHHVVVAHGTTNRAFIHMWNFKDVDWWSNFQNPGNCSIYKISGVDQGEYVFSP